MAGTSTAPTTEPATPSELQATTPRAYAVLVDELYGGTQPHCPEDDIVMRDVDGGWQCPHCGYHLVVGGDIGMPPEFDGPSIRGG